MSESHQQAMNYIYQQVLEKLLGKFSQAQRAALQLLIQRLTVAAGGHEGLASYKVFLAHGGGKTSSHTLALVRAAQLIIAERQGETFEMRVATCRHVGISPAVMDNIQSAYSALFLHDDPRVELLMVDDHQVMPFDHLQPLGEVTRRRNRDDLLMTGHLTGGDARASFCNGCYLRLADFYLRAQHWQGGVDVWVMGDAPREQKRYLSWARRSAGHAGVTSPARPGSLPDAALHMITRLGREYYRQLYGDALQPPSPALPLASRVVRTLDVHDLVGDSIDDHWRLLVEFLGFRFSELAFGFSESDCANPVLMAHLRGLLAEFAQQREYTDGVHEYLRLAATLMRRKGMSEHLIELAHSAYDNPTKIDLRRQLANRHAREGFGLNEIQLVCLVCSPFVGQGAALEPFLRRCHPGMLVALPYLHKALQGYPTPEAVTQWLVDTSGLPIIALQRLYLQEPVHFDDERSLIAQVRAGDPDKARINTLDRVTGETITVLMSGR